MKFEYTGRHIEVTPAIRAHVEGLFKRLDHLFDGHGLNAHIIIEVEKGGHRSEIIVKWRSEVLTATTTLDDMYQAIAKTVDKIEKQALKIKTKVIDKKQKAKKVTAVARPIDEVTPEPAEPRIIAAPRYNIKPMSAEEAVLQLKNEVDQFLVFRDSEDEKIAVIYKRSDGNYGLIQP